MVSLKFKSINKEIIRAVISGDYSNLELKTFFKFCYSLTLPIIRKKISFGKLNLEILGMKENDIVIDCLADIFHRDENGNFIKLQQYFENVSNDFESKSDDEILILLRQFIFTQVHNSIIRLHSEADPTLGKVIRNMKISLNKNLYFNQINRFGENFLTPMNYDPLFHNPPLPMEMIQQQFTSEVTVHDNIPEMLKKLYNLIVEVEDYQRAVSFILTARMFRDVHILGWETEYEEVTQIDDELNKSEIDDLAEKVSNELKEIMFSKYVLKAKMCEAEFSKCIQAIRQILIDNFSNGKPIASSYYEHIKIQMPELSKEHYLGKYRTILEYLAKLGKERMKEILTRN